MDIFKMANEIAKNMSLDETNNLENMDMQEMISHVTKNVFGMMNNPNSPMANFDFIHHNIINYHLFPLNSAKNYHFDVVLSIMQPCYEVSLININ